MGKKVHYVKILKKSFCLTITEDEAMSKWKPKNKMCSDIFYRLQANLPLTGYTCREQLISEWKELEKRLQQKQQKTQGDN